MKINILTTLSYMMLTAFTFSLLKSYWLWAVISIILVVILEAMVIDLKEGNHIRRLEE